jgi:predicted nucleic acid-binding protein
VREFHSYLDVLISKGHLKVLSLDYSISKIALECAREYRLLPRDALHTACCEAFGIKEMATNDADFERVGFLALWNP